MTCPRFTSFGTRWFTSAEARVSGSRPGKPCAPGYPSFTAIFRRTRSTLNSAQAGLPVSGILQPERKTGVWRMVADLPEAIAAVRKLYFDRDLGRTLGANGRTLVEQYRVDVQVEKWHHMFQSLLAS